MRCFFALEPSPASRFAIEQWRQKYLPPLDAAVPAGNYHITLAFLGEASHSQVDDMVSFLNNQPLPAPFALNLNHVGYFARPKVFWLGIDDYCPAHQQLVALSQKAAGIARINVPRDGYTPHLTLARKCKQPPAPPLVEPNIRCLFDQFHLFESVSTPVGVRYQKRFSWQLPPEINPRKQLR